MLTSLLDKMADHDGPDRHLGEGNFGLIARDCLLRLRGGFTADGPQHNAWWSNYTATAVEADQFLRILRDLVAELDAYLDLFEDDPEEHKMGILMNAVASSVGADSHALTGRLALTQGSAARVDAGTDPRKDREGTRASRRSDCTR